MICLVTNHAFILFLANQPCKLKANQIKKTIWATFKDLLDQLEWPKIMINNQNDIEKAMLISQITK
jgi:hypothetical protein